MILVIDTAATYGEVQVTVGGLLTLHDVEKVLMWFTIYKENHLSCGAQHMPACGG